MTSGTAAPPAITVTADAATATDSAAEVAMDAGVHAADATAPQPACRADGDCVTRDCCGDPGPRDCVAKADGPRCDGVGCGLSLPRYGCACRSRRCVRVLSDFGESHPSGEMDGLGVGTGGTKRR
jgi:hypothetical protein